MPEFSGTVTLHILGQTVVSVADAADHMLVLAGVTGIIKTADVLWNGGRNTNWITADTIGGKGKQTGYFQNVHQDGDTDHGTFEGTVEADGTATGTWQYTGGTGKFAHLTGNGVSSLKQTSPTESELEWSGSYNLG